MVARVLFIALTFWGNTTPPHPAGDHKGPPNPTSSALAPTDRLALCLASQPRLMRIGRPSRSPWQTFTDPTSSHMLQYLKTTISFSGVALIELHCVRAHYVQFALFQQFPELAHGSFTRNGGVSTFPFQGLNVSVSS